MRFLLGSIVLVTVTSLQPAFAQKPIGKCMRPDCASMQAYCQESRTTGQTMTHCEAAGALCAKTKKWVGTNTSGKMWSCTF